MFPFDDLHRFHRPAAMVAAAFGGELEARLQWLQPQPQVPTSFSAADLNAMQAFGLKPPTSKK